MSRRPREPYTKNQVKEFYKGNYYNNEELGNLEVDILKKDFFNTNETKLTEAQELLFREVYSRLDAITGRHQIGVVQCAKLILEENDDLEIDPKTIYLGAALHDIGKSIIEPKILETTRIYNEDEKAAIDSHSLSAKDVFEETISSINKKYHTTYTIDDFFDSKEQQDDVINMCTYHHASVVSSSLDKDLPKNLEKIDIIQNSDILESFSSPLRPYMPVKEDSAVKEAFFKCQIDIDNFSIEQSNDNEQIYVSKNTIAKACLHRLDYNKELNDFLVEDFKKISINDNITLKELFTKHKEIKNSEEAHKKMGIDIDF